eukprot:scpid63794/ scgid30932/ Leukotriene-B4 omega-hydroxylase 3; Cyp4f-14; Cytochrome P450 4F14; Cytochrome P450-LTB-omega; Leukotriene-B4 20-monooxygenase 3
MDVVLLIVTALVVWIVHGLVRLASVHYRLRSVPVLSFLEYHWLLGNIPSIMDRQNVFYNLVPKITQNEHRVRRFSVGPTRYPLIAVSHPETIGTVLKSSFPKNMTTYSLFLPFIGNGLLVSSGKKWARDRRLLTNAFHFNILQEYTPLLHDSCQVLLEKLAQHVSDAETQNKAFDFSRACCLLTLDVMLRCTMGYESNCQLKDSAYTIGVMEITKLIFARAMSLSILMPNFLYKMTVDGRKFFSLCDMCHDFSSTVIEKRRRELEESGAMAEATESSEDTLKKIRKGHTSFVDILLTVQDEDGSGLSDSEIRDQVDTFLFEGHDTTSSGMQWMFYFLAKHPDIQERCRQEAMEFSQPDGFVSHCDLTKLTYITQCIKESLRMCCPVVYIERALTEDTVIDGYTIPKGVAINIDIFGLHHNRTFYPDPYVFDPDRFSEENVKDRHPLAFIPFSAGPRNCIGQVLAMNELRLTLSGVLMRFQLTVDPSLPEPLFNDAIVMRAKNGINLLIKSI